MLGKLSLQSGRCGCKSIKMRENSKALSIASLYGDLDNFYIKIKKLMDLLGLDLTPFQADHIALRINSFQQAAMLEAQWRREGLWLSKSEVNGRPICAIGLKKPLVFNTWSIECVELPYPSQKIYQNEGWQHIEWVVALQADTPHTFFEQLLTYFPDLPARLAVAKEQGVKVKLSMPEVQGEAHCNPTVAFSLDEVAIKLHPCSLATLCKTKQTKL
ncbi:MAG: VOC family protein [Enterovibrio sp.]